MPAVSHACHSCLWVYICQLMLVGWQWRRPDCCRSGLQTCSNLQRVTLPAGLQTSRRLHKWLKCACCKQLTGTILRMMSQGHVVNNFHALMHDPWATFVVMQALNAMSNGRGTFFSSVSFVLSWFSCFLPTFIDECFRWHSSLHPVKCVQLLSSKQTTVVLKFVTVTVVRTVVVWVCCNNM